MPYDANGNWVADTTTPGFDNTGGLTLDGAPANSTAAAAGSGFDIGGFLTDFMRTGGSYYLGDENIKNVQATGRELQDATGLLSEQARAGTAFQPYSVTSDLANVATNAQGGFDVNLNPQQAAMQKQLMGQAQGLFGQVGQDPAAQQAAIYEQIRATQRPDEQRQALDTEARLLSQGRLGVSSNQYGGGSPELFAQETARQEAMGRANLGARNQALAEQEQSLRGAQGLLTAGYDPQKNALAMLQGSAVPAGYADIGRRTGTELGSQLDVAGLEGRLNAEQMANQLRLGQQSALLEGMVGSEMSTRDKLLAAALDQGTDGTGGLMAAIFKKFGLGG
jgi:hypothetical protein